MAAPVTLPSTRKIMQIVEIRPGSVGRLTAASAPVRMQIRIGSSIRPYLIQVEVGGCAGIVHPHVGILHTIQRAMLQVELVGQLAHGAYARFSFSKAGFLNCKGVLTNTYGREDTYKDYDDYKLYEGKTPLLLIGIG